MTRLLAVLCSLLLAITIAGTDVAFGQTTSQPSANQTQAQPSTTTQPSSQMGTTGAGPTQGTQGVQIQGQMQVPSMQVQPAPGTQMQPTAPGVQIQTTPGVQMGPVAPGVQVQPSPGVQMQTTPSMQVQPTPGMQMQPVAPSVQMQQPESIGAIEGAGPTGMQACPMGSIAVDDRNIYVLRGNQVLRYNKSDMRLVGCTSIPAATMAQATPSVSGQGPAVQAGTACPSGSACPMAQGCPSGTICPSGSACPGVAACPPMGAGPAAVTLRTDLTPRPAFQQMLQSMQQLSPCDYDKAYLQAMIQAQCGAVEWSNLANSEADHADLRRFAERVADDESQLSVKYSTWLHDWYGLSSRTCERATPIDEDTLACLRNYSGRDFELAYMQAMITYYSESILLACNAQQKAARPELKAFAADLSARYNRNIQQLRSWAATWYGVQI